MQGKLSHCEKQVALLLGDAKAAEVAHADLLQQLQEQHSNTTLEKEVNGRQPLACVCFCLPMGATACTGLKNCPKQAQSVRVSGLTAIKPHINGSRQVEVSLHNNIVLNTNSSGVDTEC